MPFTTLRRIAGGLRLPLALAAIAVLASPSVARAQGALPKLSPQLDSVRAGLNKYQDPMVAVADGYLSTVACIDFPKPFAEGPMSVVAGGMGVHFLNLSTIGPTLDPTKPQVLIYEPHGRQAGARGRGVVHAGRRRPARRTPRSSASSSNGPMEGHPADHAPGAAPLRPARLALEGEPGRRVLADQSRPCQCPKGGYTPRRARRAEDGRGATRTKAIFHP